jgi:hypothetical protein
MKKVATIIILTITLHRTNAQTHLDFGKIISDSAFDCAKNGQWESGLFNINSICDSKNQFELRLTTFGRPNGFTELILLTFDKQKWDIKKYENSRGTIGRKMTQTTFQPTNDTSTNFIYRLVFDTLRANDAFSLPDQATLNLKGHAADGAAYMLTFKVMDKFGSYRFRNLEYFSSVNTDIIELKKYSAIMKMLRGLFE